jgi:hypothetical protein
VWGVIGTGLELYRRFPFLFLALALAVIAPFDLAVLAIAHQGPLQSGSGGKAEATVVLIDLINFSLIGPLISALCVHAVVLIGAGERPKLGDVATRGVRVLPVVAAAEIMATLGIAVGFLFFIVPGILLAARWAVVAQAAAIEREGWLPALRRSGELAAGRYLHILAVLIAVTLFAALVTLLGAAIATGPGTGAGPVALGIAAHTVAASLTAVITSILYFDLRSRPRQDHRLTRPRTPPGSD